MYPYALEDSEIEQCWSEEGNSIYKVIQPVVENIGDIKYKEPYKMNENLFLVPGDIDLNGYEDRLGETWPSASVQPASIRVQIAAYRYIKYAASSCNAQIVLVDLGPNLGALNRTILGGCDYFITPLSPDLFSIKGTQNLGNKFVIWHDEWENNLRKWMRPNSGIPNDDLPKGLPKFLGYVTQQHNIRNSKSGMTRGWNIFGSQLENAVKENIITPLLPLDQCENRTDCELGPRSTGKSYIYEQISPNSILVAGGQTTVANLFYNMSNHTVGLVGMWDCVAFDEVAGIKFKDKDGIQIMKGYMASGAFSRGKAEIQAKASMVFVGNINQSVDTLLKTSSLFDPFPPEMGTDTAFLDRMHCYIPGWEIPKYRPDSFTNDYGFITDYLSEFMRELRKDSYSDLMDKYFRLGNNLNQRDTIAVRKMISGFTKLLYPDGEVTKEELREIVEISLELRRRVKEQLKKIGGMEFYDVNFSYTDNDSFEEHYVSVPEQGGGKLIPEGMGKPGSVYTVSKSKTGMIGCYMLETQMMPGNGKLTCTGIGSGKEPKEATNTAFNYLKANGNRISGQISTTTKDYIINYQDMQGIGMTGNLALPTLIAICSAALGKTPLNSLAILGEISIGGTLIKVDELASTLQVCLDSGAKKVLLPITSAGDLGTVPSDLVGAFSLIFYSSAEEAVFKALGVE